MWTVDPDNLARHTFWLQADSGAFDGFMKYLPAPLSKAGSGWQSVAHSLRKQVLELTGETNETLCFDVVMYADSSFL